MLAIAPTPFLLPVLVPMLLWRRKALTTTVLAGLLATLVGFGIAGPEPYRRWLDVLTNCGRQSVAGTSAFSLHENLSLWPLDLLRIVLAVLIVAAAGWTMLRDQTRGFVAALLGGLLLAPYTGMNSRSCCSP
jgi:hypothetical protein